MTPQSELEHVVKHVLDDSESWPEIIGHDVRFDSEQHAFLVALKANRHSREIPSFQERYRLHAVVPLARHSMVEVRFDVMPAMAGPGICRSLDTSNAVALQDTWIAATRSDSYLQKWGAKIDSVVPLKVREECADTRTRSAVQGLRTKVRSRLTTASGEIVLDLGGVKSASSSFLDETLGRLAADLGPAEARLRALRNDIAHLKKPPEDDLPRVCEQATLDLRSLCQAASFLARTPLAWLEDSARDLGGQRRATLRILQGTSPVHARRTRDVSSELTRGDIGIFDEAGAFWSLAPWLRRMQCPQCKTWELFSFSSLEKKGVTYVAMASGHRLDVPDEGGRVAKLFERTRP